MTWIAAPGCPLGHFLFQNTKLVKIPPASRSLQRQRFDKSIKTSEMRTQDFLYSQRSAHGALEEIRGHIQAGYQAVYDADLKGYFDSIPHSQLLACVAKRVADGSVMKLIRMWLKTPVAEEQGGGKPPKVSRSKSGTPQGGVISPLLSNIYLHWFDKVFYGQDGPGQWANAKLVRYADDFVVLARYQTKRIAEFIESKLERWMGLELNREKTRIVDLKRTGAQPGFSGIHLPIRPRPVWSSAPLSESVSLEESSHKGAGPAAGNDQQSVLL
jgi:RNA-directed DNA polymerase